METPFNPSDLFLGVDGGGSKTLAVAMLSDGTVLSMGRGGPTNRVFADQDECMHSTDQAIGGALNSPSVGSYAVRLAAFTGPGSVRGFTNWQERIQEAAWIGEGSAALAAALERYGTAVVAGTGSVAAYSGEDGRQHTAGGWGGLIGDEGSGYYIAVEGLRAVAKATDRRIESTELVSRALSFFNMNHPREIIGRIHNEHVRRHHIAAFCREVLEAADAGDAAARDVVNRAVDELVLAARTAMRELSPGKAVPVVLSGGVFQGSRLAKELFEVRIHESFPNARVVLPRFAPAIGALLWAWRDKGYTPDESVLNRIEHTYEELVESNRN